jgi:subtilisin family serine protease
MSNISQSNDPYLITNPDRRIKWDDGAIYRDLWQWGFTPVGGYQTKAYTATNVEVPQYAEPASVYADLGIYKAWETTKGNEVVVAIADSGCHMHTELKNRVIGGIAVSGLGNWNTDTNGHGTHVASVIAAEGNNGLEVVGVAPESKLYIIKCNYNCRDIPFVVDSAIAANASILVIAWGFSENDPLAKQALIKAKNNGIIVVCSTFNQPIDAGSQPDYPIQWKLPNVVAVTNSTMADVPYSWAAYSNSLIHLYAPGRLIVVATIPSKGTYAYTSGTSFSAPLVAGSIALIQSAHPYLTMQKRIDTLLASVDRLPQYAGKTITGGRLNVGWSVSGPKQNIVLENGKPTIYFYGPSNSFIQVEETTDFVTWTLLPLLQADVLGVAKLYPTGNMGYYRSRFVRPQSELESSVTIQSVAAQSVSLWKKIFKPKRPTIHLSKP